MCQLLWHHDNRCMHDRELYLEVLRQVEGAAIKIGSRFQVIHQASDFTDTPAGVEKLDSICMTSSVDRFDSLHC